MSARDDAYTYMTVAFQETGVPPVIHEQVTKLLDAYRAEVLREAADVVAHRLPVEVLPEHQQAWRAGRDAAIEVVHRMAEGEAS
jgi:hypothetical protein